MGKRITAMIISAVCIASLCSCSLYEEDSSGTVSVPPLPETDSLKTGSDERPDIETVNAHIEQLLEDVRLPDNEDAVISDISQLMRDADLTEDELAYLTIEYYADWYDEDKELSYDQCSEDMYVINEALYYAFSKCMDSEYAYLFEDYVDEDDVAYYSARGMSLARAEGYAQVDYRVSDENLDSFYDIAYDDSLDEDEKNIRCAEIYLDIMSDYDPETFYGLYNRDYSPEDIVRLAKAVREELIPAADHLDEKYYSEDNIFSSFSLREPVSIDRPFERIRECAEELSPDILRSAERINDEELYYLAGGYDCYDGSFTIDLPAQNSAFVYVYDDDSYYTFMTAVHEFGHFHASFYDDTNSFMSAANLDIAETQSQAMELLFMRFYDELYGRDSDKMKLIEVSNILNSVITGFLIGEFEYTVLTKGSGVTPEEIVGLYSDILGDYAYSYPFYYVNHLFESPGYYISYGVSALAAMDILDECLNEPDKALTQYEKIAGIPANSPDTRFSAALSECGFSDVLTEKYVAELADNIRNFADKL